MFLVGSIPITKQMNKTIYCRNFDAVDAAIQIFDDINENVESKPFASHALYLAKQSNGGNFIGVDSVYEYKNKVRSQIEMIENRSQQAEEVKVGWKCDRHDFLVEYKKNEENETYPTVTVKKNCNLAESLLLRERCSKKIADKVYKLPAALTTYVEALDDPDPIAGFKFEDFSGQDEAAQEAASICELSPVPESLGRFLYKDSFLAICDLVTSKTSQQERREACERLYIKLWEITPPEGNGGSEHHLAIYSIRRALLGLMQVYNSQMELPENEDDWP